LHLKHGVKVSDLGPHHYRVEPVELGPGRTELVACDYFRIEKLRVAEAMRIGSGAPYYMLLTCLHGNGEIAGQKFNAGTSWLVPALAEPFEIRGKGSEWILCYTDAQHARHIGV
jgi:mannose-6-phosphate isomerase class I